ncbi:MAG: ferrous iron transporter B [Clostridiales bacterium]|nr:ferrous iron transporter B [Clostridiales bacterium]
MCMGFGCNACGVIGCRIIDSPRERLIAILTNSLVPCNGRFPAILSLITMFFTVGITVNLLKTTVSTLMLLGIIVLGVLMTLLVSKILSKTILKGIPSSFALELPPYRTPQFGQVIIRSLFERTLFVLGRAVVVAAPAGIIIWVLANINVEGITLLSHLSGFLDPFGKFLGLDGVILLGFILGFPANEIVIPIIIMAYLSTGNLVETDSLIQLKELFVANGWTWVTALCTILFSLLHFPCSTTCLTIYKETKSIKWTGLAIIIPTVIGILVCSTVAGVSRLFI